MIGPKSDRHTMHCPIIPPFWQIWKHPLTWVTWRPTWYTSLRCRHIKWDLMALELRLWPERASDLKSPLAPYKTIRYPCAPPHWKTGLWNSIWLFAQTTRSVDGFTWDVELRFPKYLQIVTFHLVLLIDHEQESDTIALSKAGRPVTLVGGGDRHGAANSMKFPILPRRPLIERSMGGNSENYNRGSDSLIIRSVCWWDCCHVVPSSVGVL